MNVKRKLIFGVMLLTLCVGNVKAATISDLKGKEASTHIKVECEEGDKKCTFTLTDNANQDLVIEEGEEVTLNLESYSLTSTDVKYSAIDIQGGKLTIEGNGTIKVKDGDKTTNVPTVNVKSGAELVMNGGTIEGIAVDHSAALYNAGKLTINDGTIKSVAVDENNGNKGAWGLTNVGTATITGGTFIQGNAFSVLSNNKTMTISGGVFSPEGTGIRNSLITNVKGAEVDAVTLTITDGTFKAASGAKIISVGSDEGKKGTATITGGLFIETGVDAAVAVKNYMGSESIVKLNDTMYVGTSTTKVAEDAKANDTIEVLQGDYTETEMPAGITVKNSGGGIVTINGETVEAGSSIITKEKVEEEKINTIVEGVTYETEEDVVLEGTVITETNDVFAEMIKEAEAKGYTQILKMFEFKEKEGKTFAKPITITFEVGSEYNDKVVYIIHRLHDGSYQKAEEVVKDGKVSITVTELSPFIIALKEEETAEEVKPNPTPNNAQTSSMNVLGYGIVGVASLGGLVILAKKRKENN